MDFSARLLPRPRQLHREDDARSTGVLRVQQALTGIGPQSEAWQILQDLQPGTLPGQGYTLRIRVESGQAHAVVAAVDDAGLFYAHATLRQLAAGDGVPAVSIRDWPQLAERGIIEGFYGGPWSHQDRLDYMTFAGSVKLNRFIYAPKDEPYHRERWRDLYPEAELLRLRELAVAAAANHIRFVYALSPGLSMRFSDEADHALLAAKAGQLWDAGIRSFALLFDDVLTELPHAVDHARPVIVYYSSGSRLPDATLAPGARVTFFLGSEGVAPWLMSAAGHALVDAAIDHITSPVVARVAG